MTHSPAFVGQRVFCADASFESSPVHVGIVSAPEAALCILPTRLTNRFPFELTRHDGTIMSYDSRVQGGVVGVLPERAEFNDLAWHPTMTESFLSADERGGVLLHDARVCFQESSRGKTARRLAVRKVRLLSTCQVSVSFSKDSSPSLCFSLIRACMSTRQTRLTSNSCLLTTNLRL